jgi:DNA-binding GntR family transcriptional regulator
VAPRGTYREIAEELRRLIGRGELRPGDMVPSELALAEHYAVARGTARSALAQLVDEGLIEVVPRQGRRVVGEATGRLPGTEWGRVAAALRERLEAGGSQPTRRCLARPPSSPSSGSLATRCGAHTSTFICGCLAAAPRRGPGFDQRRVRL